MGPRELPKFMEPATRRWSDYLEETRRPLTSLAFVSPMLLIYELGAFIAGPQALRNGADVLLRRLLDWTGFGHYFLLPLLMVGALLAWHHLSREPWRIREQLLGTMFLESIGWGLLLLAFAKVLALFFMFIPGLALPSLAINLRQVISQMVSPFGAGIYEELLFRVMLFPLLLTVLLRGLPLFYRSSDAPLEADHLETMSYLVAIMATSLLFSAAHYELFTGYGDPFQIYSFVFRTFAGIYFCVLFIYRGFGIAVGAHALYDVFVVALNFLG